MSDDLMARLDRTRLLWTPWSDDPARGIAQSRLESVLERWRTGYDWTAHERRISALGWNEVPTAHGPLRLVRRGPRGAATVVLLHGWPDSVLRFERVLPLLEDLDVVVPALPGYPFSAPLDAAGMSVERMAGMVADALAELRIERYTLSGGDVGGTVAELIAAAHPDRVTALHLTNIAPQHAFAVDPAALPAAAEDYLARSAAWFRSDGGYIAEQSTRPGTLAVGLGDSPAGLAAWIVEKLDAWSDGDAFTLDELLTWISAYWHTGTIASSFTSYVEPARIPRRIDTPTVLSIFPRDLKPEPREYAELFHDVREYIEHSRGGHFAAWEEPEAYASDLRTAVALSE